MRGGEEKVHDIRLFMSSKLGMEPIEIDEAIKHRSDYRKILKPKKDGTMREIFSPHRSLKLFQKNFLDFLYQEFGFKGFEYIHGFVPKRSCLTNANIHLGSRFVFKLDLHKAFPSVKIRHIKYALQKIYKWNDPCIEDFFRLVIPLITLRGELPQGAPASPHLINLVLIHSGLVEKVREFLSRRWTYDFKLSLYADDFTVSSKRPIPWEIKKGLIDLIERSSDFRVNRNKIFYFNRKSVAPIVTGLKLVSYRVPGERLNVVHPSKDYVKRVRGMIHKATYFIGDKEELEDLMHQVSGHIAHMKSIYSGGVLPRQIAVPFAQLQNKTEGKPIPAVFMPRIHKQSEKEPIQIEFSFLREIKTTA